MVRRSTAAFLVMAGSVLVWIRLDVRCFRLIGACEVHCVQSAARTTATPVSITLLLPSSPRVAKPTVSRYVLNTGRSTYWNPPLGSS